MTVRKMRQQAAPKYWYLHTNVQDIISDKNEVLVSTRVRTSYFENNQFLLPVFWTPLTYPIHCGIFNSLSLKNSLNWKCKEWVFKFFISSFSEPGSSVGIATDYGLEDPGSNPGGDEIFRPSRPTQPPVKWVPCLSRGKVRPGRTADHSPTSSAAVMEE